GWWALAAPPRRLQELAGQARQALVVEKQPPDLRARLFLHVQRLSLSHHDRGGTAESIARIDKDAREAQAIVVESVFPSITAGLGLATLLVRTPPIAWPLA